MPLVSVQNYLSVSVPSMSQAEQIADRLNGELIVLKVVHENGIERQTEELARVSLQNIRRYEGGRNQSMVLDGYKTILKMPKNTILENVVYRNMANGSIQIVRTANPDTYLESGDLAIDGNNEFEVSSITISVGSDYCQMDIEG